jgi:hypothetical protein
MQAKLQDPCNAYRAHTFATRVTKFVYQESI